MEGVAMEAEVRGGKEATPKAEEGPRGEGCR